jgi:hypothetical protein
LSGQNNNIVIANDGTHFICFDDDETLALISLMLLPFQIDLSLVTG